MLLAGRGIGFSEGFFGSLRKMVQVARLLLCLRFCLACRRRILELLPFW